MTRKKSIAFIIILILGFFIILEAGYILNLYKNKSSSMQMVIDPYEAENIYSVAIDNVGPAKAYDQFKLDMSGVESFGRQHSLAHIFGSVLYKKAGLEGFNICDDAFAYGCYHSFIGEAINDMGIDIMHTLDKLCNEKPYKNGNSACQHGIGHGLLGHMGYREEDLLQALNYCSSLTYKGPLAGCAGGAFMEYNQRSMADPAGSGNFHRELDPSDPYDPCNDVKDQFKIACYYNLSAWWKVVFEYDYEKVGRLCQQAPEDAVSSCLLAIAEGLADDYSNDPEKVREQCQKMPTIYMEIGCRADAASMYKSNFNRPEFSNQLCGDLEEGLKNQCLSRIH
jgi:hypothetical protein